MGTKGDTTRQRLLDAALDLFAAKGFKSTTTAEIEAAAGLTPGAGGLYRHFPSKAALIDAALAEQEPALEALEAAQNLLPLGDLQAELLLVARGALAAMTASRRVLSIIESDRSELTAASRASWLEMLDRSYSAAAELLTAILDSHDLPVPADSEAVAVVALGSLANYVRERHVHGRDPAGVTEDRFVAAWVGTCLAIAASEPAPRSTASARANARSRTI